MAFITLQQTPVDPAQGPVRVHLRDAGSGPPLVLLHGGWGYEAYPFDRAMALLSGHHRVLAPDRVGYGRSGRLGHLPEGFHPRMAEETMLVLDALGLRSAVLWGHSDGAVIALWAAILFPGRVEALLLEALHFVAAKVRSIEFFRAAVEAPERFGEPVVQALTRDHGARWRDVVGAGGRAWLRIIEEGARGRLDLYDGRAREVRVPTLLLHGARDPRTEPGELEAARAALPHAQLELLDASHSPHTSTAAAEACLLAAGRFLEGHRARAPAATSAAAEGCAGEAS